MCERINFPNFSIMKKIIIVLLIVGLVAGAYLWISQQKINMGEAIAPVHSDDVGEPGSVKPDIALVASENIVGTWQSERDPKSTRVYSSDGTLVDMYDGRELSRGTWKAFTAEKPAAGVSITLEADTVYIQETLVNEAETAALNLQVAKLTPENLELVYIEGVGSLAFSRVK